jgi:hypothetical protein
MLTRFALLALGALLLGVLKSHADEGMWLFNHPPRQILKERYGFNPTDEWLDHVQKSSVRFNSGGSGSFVSPDGLVMTNHHVGLSTLQKMSSKDKDYVKDGFYARSRSAEVRSVDLELNVLMSIEDVTSRVKAAVKPSMAPEEAFKARRAVMADIEKESLEKTRLRSNVITLYQGGLYHLYRFKKYTDVRLVFAPEQQIAFYGGDPDNFEYPRYDLDVCLFRVYEHGKPVKAEHYFKWSKAGATNQELVFVPGHPGKTDRLTTVAELEYLRDRAFPGLLQRLYRWEVFLGSYSERSAENARKAKDFYFSVRNSRKARDGGLAGLLDPALMAEKREAERRLRKEVEMNPKLKDAADAWDKVAQVQKIKAKHAREYVALEAGLRNHIGAAFNSKLFDIARSLVRAADELPKKNAERLEEFTDSNLAPLELRIFSREPLYKDYEELKLADGLTYLEEQLGHRNKLVQQILAGKSPRERATELIQGTRLQDVDLRKMLYKGGKKAIDASDDPMILLAKLVDPESRRVRKIIDDQVEEVSQQAYDQIAKAKFAVEGTNTYPDATFTLRLAFGIVKGYEEGGKEIHFETHFSGLYKRAKEHKYAPPFDLPQRWLDRKDRLNLKTPFNFVSTADIIGGNSGSPVINRDAEIVGLIFDGNIQSLVLDFAYTEKQARALAVHSSAIIEALRKVYDAEELANELTGGKQNNQK